MTYACHDETVTLEMTRNDFDVLLMILGYATGAASERPDDPFFSSIIRFTNELNRTNPRFTPYAVPEPEEPRT